MKKLLLLGVMAIFSGLGVAAEPVTTRAHIVGSKGREIQVALMLDVDTHHLTVKDAAQVFAVVPFDSLQSMTYDQSKRHRLKEGAFVMVGSLGAGAVVMLTRSTNHWLLIKYLDNSSVRDLTVRLDKKDYRKVLNAVQSATGKEVGFVGGRF